MLSDHFIFFFFLKEINVYIHILHGSHIIVTIIFIFFSYHTLLSSFSSLFFFSVKLKLFFQLIALSFSSSLDQILYYVRLFRTNYQTLYKNCASHTWEINEKSKEDIFKLKKKLTHIYNEFLFFLSKQMRQNKTK